MLGRIVFSFSKRSAFLSVQGNFSVYIFKRVKSVAPFSCRLAGKHRSSNALRDLILETFLRVGDKNGTIFRLFATNIRVSDDTKKRLFHF